MGVKNRTWVSIFIHLLLWCLFFSLPLLPMLVHKVPPRLVIVNMYLHLGLVVIVFYTNYFLLIPKFLFQKKRASYLAMVVALLVIVFVGNVAISKLMGIEQLLDQVFKNTNSAFARMARMEFMPVLLSVLGISLGLAIRLAGKWLVEKESRERLEKERLQAELAFLKAQINPHFFFNTMNLIYALTETDPAKAQHAIHKLSKLMRYVLYESERPRVELDREIAFLEDYLELMRMRLPENIEVDFDCQVKSRRAMVPPLLLVPFVENALKYGVTTKEQKRIRFELKGEEALHFRAVNEIFIGKQVPEDQKGVGLANVKRRLGLLFPKGNFSLDIAEREGKFEVELKIPMK